MGPQNAYKRNSFKKEPVYGSTLPKKMQEELDEQEEQDDRKFGKKFTIKIANRKELRKQKRAEKGKRKAEMHQKKRPHDLQPKGPDHKRQKTEPEKKKPAEKKVEEKKVEAQKRKTTEKSKAEAMDRLAKTNPGLYKLLQSDKLVEGGTADQDFDEDDRYIAYFEKKLGMSKKKDKKLGKEFEEDGLTEILGNIDGADEANDENDDDMTYLKKKREKQAMQKKHEDLETSAEKAVDDIFADFDSEEEDDDEDMEGLDEMMEDYQDDDSEESEDDAEVIGEDDIDSDEMGVSDDDESEEEESEKEDEKSSKSKKKADKIEVKEEKPTQPTKASVLTKYVPPHLRKTATTKTEIQIKLQKQLQGQLNRLSESNIESILMEVEKCYGSYPRHDVTSTLTELILVSISQKSNLLDSFVIIYATIVASLYRLIGIEFAAHFVQTLIEMFEKEFKKCKDTIAQGAIDNEDGIEGSKETKNLLILILELYNFQVLSCVIVYDLVHMLIAGLDETNVELLLKIIRTSGPELRNDDPASLKDIITEIQKETAKRDPKTISIRHKFMLETITDIKNNKIKHGQTAGGLGDREMVSKMKKFLNGLAKKRTVRSTEALRVSLDDIRNVETKGKWWLVGASWKDNLVGTESKYSTTKTPEDLKKDESMQQTLLKLARKQGMNTDIRRTIFVTVMSAEDYLDAFEKLMKLGLTEVQQREICRVMLQCTGNEKTFNPYYMLVSKKLCEVDHSFKVTFQYCLWDFLRECGESDVGGLERSATENAVSEDSKLIRLSKLSNMAKFYASLIANGALTLAVLKSVNFMSVKRNGRIFLEVLFSNLLLQLHSGGAQAVANVFGKILDLRVLAQGCNFFILETVTHGKHTGLSESDLEKVHWSCKIAREVLGSNK